MKACIIQTEYSLDSAKADELFDKTLELLDRCDERLDLIVCPEYSDFPTAVSSTDEFNAMIEKYNGAIMQKAKETAVRCHALVFVNCAYKAEGGYRNTTHAINPEGEVIGRYFKAHPAPSEATPLSEGGRGMDFMYSYEYSEPYVLEYDGVRYGFLTCYDFYFYENYASLAKQNLDVIIGCSHQRSDTHLTLDFFGRFIAYNTGAYLVRSSVSLGENSETGGSSMIVSPSGEMLYNMVNDVGLAIAEFNPHKKHLKPMGFNRPLGQHREYVEEGRRPWLYRTGGAAVIADDKHLPYPRICAHRGFNSVAPENSLPAYGAAVALGAEEIEFDLWRTKDGELVSIHDCELDRVSNGTGYVWDYTLEELRKFDFGVKTGERFKGLTIPTFEDILKKFACQTIMNIHVKPAPSALDEVEHIAALIRKYDCQKHCYIMSGMDELQRKFGELAPDIRRCMGAGDEPWRIVDRAIELGCEKVQLFKPYFNQEMIDKAHAHGIICNVFWSDDPEETAKFLDMGIDVILTNDYLTIANAAKAHLNRK